MGAAGLAEVQEGLRVRLQLLRREAIGELDLGDAVRFYPSDGALERWQTGSHGPIAIVVADTANPVGGFTDAEYAQFGAMFDTFYDRRSAIKKYVLVVLATGLSSRS